MIDLRSDTVTQPCKAMRVAMCEALVGDDVYGEDPTVNELQEEVADLLGMEDALFVPSGTMANQIGLAVSAGAGDEVLVDKDAHLIHYENAAASVISRAQLLPVSTESGYLTDESVREFSRPNAYYYPRTKLVWTENTHNRLGGTVVPISDLESLRAACIAQGIVMHCDGARLWHASVANSIPVSVIARCFDTVAVCFSKGLGAPAGSALVGSKDVIREARRWRKMLGGGMRQTGILAAAALFALRNNISRLAKDHENAGLFASIMGNSGVVNLHPKGIQTNIVLFTCPGLKPAEFSTRLHERGVLISEIQPGVWRAVFHKDIDENTTTKAGEIVVDVIAGLCS